MQDGLNVQELTDFARNFIDKTSKQYPNEVKKFLRSEGNKLKRRILKNAKNKFNHRNEAKNEKHKKAYINKFNRGQPYQYKGDENAVRVYNNSNHAHLLEYGHRIVDRYQNEHGFKQGEHIVDNTSKEFKEEFAKDIENWVDDMLNKGID